MNFKLCITYQNWDNNLVDVSLTQAIESQKNCPLYNCSQDGDKDNDAYAQCLKITQNVAFDFFNFGIFH